MSKVVSLIILFVAVAAVSFWVWSQKRQEEQKEPEVTQILNENMISLPEPKLKSQVSLEEAIKNRRSRREFQNKPLALAQLSQILWAAQGITGESWGIKLRAAPSAGALYPLEIYVVVGERGVGSLEAGVYHYFPETHKLEVYLKKDVKSELFEAALSQESVLQAPISLVIVAEYERTTSKYGERGIRYVWQESGHAAQNVYLQAEVLGLGTVVLGAFVDDAVAKTLNLPSTFKPLYVMPIGVPK